MNTTGYDQNFGTVNNTADPYMGNSSLTGILVSTYLHKINDIYI